MELMSTRHQAVMDVVFPDNQAHKEHPERTANPANQEHPVPQVIPESRQQLHANRPHLLLANLVHKDHPDHPDHQEALETPVKLELQDDQELMLLQEAPGHEDLPDHQENPAQSDPTANQVSQLNQSHSYPEKLENPEIKDQLDHPEPQDHPETMDHQDQQDQKENPAQMELPAKTDNLAQQDHPEDPEALERRVSARNTAPWTEVCSSRTVRVDKLKIDRILYDSQASPLPLQRNAVFFLSFFQSFLSISPSIYGNLGKSRWKLPPFSTLL